MQTMLALMAIGRRQRTRGELCLGNGASALQWCWCVNIETPILDSDKGLVACLVSGRKRKNRGCGGWVERRRGRMGRVWGTRGWLVGVNRESLKLLVQFSFSCY